MTSPDESDREFHALLELSAWLGGDPARTQGAGGNTSIKHGGVMRIKASGEWLANALRRDIMTSVLLPPLLEALRNDDPRAENVTAFVAAAPNSTGLRPSIETSVHAVLPHRIVVHIHCVDTIALAVRADAETAIAPRLAAFQNGEWAFVPYAKPGLPLARAIGERTTAKTNVFILGNHGLVVGADTVAEAADRTQRICGALAARPGPAPPRDLGRLAAIVAGGDYRLPTDAAAHALALDPRRLSIARRGSLYPDHVVFLGPGIVEGAVVDGRLAAPAGLDPPAPMLIVPGLGVGLHRAAPKGSDEMARCLADVTGRIPEDAPIHTLTAAQERELLNWDAEKYRRSLGTSAGGAA